MRPEARMLERETLARRYRVHVGVDAGKAFHKLVACGPDRVRTRAVRVEVTRAGFTGAVEFLRTQFPDVPPGDCLVAIEFAGHYGYTFAEFLRGHGFAIVTMPSVVTKRLREVEDNSPRKDDAKDAAQSGPRSRRISRTWGCTRRGRCSGGGRWRPTSRRPTRAPCTR